MKRNELMLELLKQNPIIHQQISHLTRIILMHKSLNFKLLSVITIVINHVQIIFYLFRDSFGMNLLSFYYSIQNV